LLQSTHKNPISDASELIGLARQRHRAICNRTGKSPEFPLKFQVGRQLGVVASWRAMARRSHTDDPILLLIPR
jgi:hypothetical protein